MKAWQRIIFSCVALLLLGLAPVGAVLAQIRVTAATPSSASQGTISLDVVVTGSGFDRTAKVQYLVSGTINPGGITVKNVTFRSSKELVTTIDVADTAALASFDIVVMLGDGRKGKGTTLFSVTAKTNSLVSYAGENLGTLPGDKYSDAWSVNASGNVVGRSYYSTIRAFYWSGTMYQLPSSAAARNTPPYTVAWDVEATDLSNGPSEIAVGYENRRVCESGSGACTTDQYPVYWIGDLTKGPDAVRLDTAKGSAHGINQAGSIAVGSSGLSAGALWRRGASSWARTDIPLGAFVCDACEYESGGAWDVNDAGVVVGFLTRKIDYLQFAYVYNSQTATGRILPIPAGYVQSSAYAVSNVTNGIVHIAGVASPCTGWSCDTDRGIRWTVNLVSLQASFEILDQMAWAEGVTDQGFIAGTHNSAPTRRGNIIQTAYLWKQPSGYVSLNPPSGSDSTSRSMVMGSNGTVFVVGETNSKGAWTAARWVIP